MALAAFKLVKCTGTNAAVETDCGKHPTFISADIVNLDTELYPITVPVSAAVSPTRSFENWLRLELTGLPDNYCQNFKIWGPAAQPDAGDTPGDRMTIYIGTTAAGATPTDAESSVAVEAQHDQGSVGYFSQATALAIDVEASDNKIEAIGEKTDYVVLQLWVQDLAQQGGMQTVVFNWYYEEA